MLLLENRDTSIPENEGSQDTLISGKSVFLGFYIFLKNRFELEIIIRQRQRRDTRSDSDETNSIVDHMLLELRTKKRTLARTELRHLDYTTGSVVFSSF